MNEPHFETLNKLYLELSHVVSAGTRTEREIRLEESLKDSLVISDLILRGNDGKLASISSGLTADFQTNTNAFNIRQADGDEYRVTVKIEPQPPKDK